MSIDVNLIVVVVAVVVVVVVVEIYGGGVDKDCLGSEKLKSIGILRAA